STSWGDQATGSAGPAAVLSSTTTGQSGPRAVPGATGPAAPGGTFCANAAAAATTQNAAAAAKTLPVLTGSPSCPRRSDSQRPRESNCSFHLTRQSCIARKHSRHEIL